MHINLGQNLLATPGNPGTTRPAKCRLIPLNFSGPGEIIRQLARPCSHSNTYVLPPLLPHSAVLPSSGAREAARDFLSLSLGEI
jgi:hypothetical protein